MKLFDRTRSKVTEKGIKVAPSHYDLKLFIF